MSSSNLVKIKASPSDNLSVEIEVDEKFEFMKDVLGRRDGPNEAIEILKKNINPKQIMEDTNEQKTWEAIGNFYKNAGRFYESIEIYSSLYEYMLVAQKKYRETSS